MITYAELSQILIVGGAYLKNQDPEVIFTIASRGKTYAEIGTMWGGSAIVAGLAGCEVYCIDPWGSPQRAMELSSPEIVRRNWDVAGLDQNKLHLYQQAHPPWPEEIGEIDIGLIDGDHLEEAVRLDWEGMKEHATKYILFHDVAPIAKQPDVGPVFLEAAADPEWEEEKLPQFDTFFGLLRHAPRA